MDHLAYRDLRFPGLFGILKMKYLGQFSRMAYIKDYELREIFIKKTKKDKTLEVPCEQCDQKVKRAAIDTGSQNGKTLIFSF